MRLLLAVLLVLLRPGLTPAGMLEGLVVRVVDGDTIHVRLLDGRLEKVR